MGLFGFGKKKEKKVSCCCGSASAEAAADEPVCCCVESACDDSAQTEADCCCACGGNGCNIKVLGAGCKSCHEQYENVQKAVADMNLNAEVEYITDMEIVMNHGVMSMPAIVVNEQVVSMGKVLKVGQVEELLKKLGC